MTVQYSIQKMVSDGTLSTVVLGIQYLQRNDIYMRIAGEETPQSGAPSGYTWYFLDNTTLKITPTVPNTIEVVVYRRTDVDAMYNTYSQNAQFDEATIDENNQQLLYIAQEYLEQGIPGAGVDIIEFIRDDGINTYYRIKRTDGSYSDEFAVPSVGSATKILAREALRRTYAEAGYNLVSGSFEAGGKLVNANDALLYEADGKAYSWGGVLPKTVPAGSTPSSSGGISASAWIDRSLSPSAFKQSGAGAVPRTMLDKAREVVSVKDFGAVGNGVADDTTAIQNAINYMGTNGTVFFPDGEYRVSSTLSLSNDHVWLQGELNARIKRYGAFEILRINGSYNKVSNLQFMGNKATYPFPSFPRAALVLVTGDFNIISDNQIEEGNSHGILFRTAGAPQFNLVEGNIVLNCEEVGIAHDGGVDNRILGNHVSGCGFEGITLDQSSVRCIVDGNRINANCQSGGVGSIGIDWTDLCVISNNVITASGTLSGITFQNNLGPSNRNVISGNVFVDNLAYGVWLKNNTGGTCNDNVITGNMFGASGSIKIDSNCSRNILSGNSYAAFPDVHPDSYCRVDNALVNFYVKNTVTRSNVTGDGTAYNVPYNTIIQERNINSTSSFNTSTGVFTAPITASYTFSAGVLTQSSPGGLADSVLVEIVTSAGTFTQTFSATDQDVFGGSVTASFFLKRGETAFVRVIVSGGSKTYSVTGSINANYFTGVLVG